jgi:hypothetical protein
VTAVVVEATTLSEARAFRAPRRARRWSLVSSLIVVVLAGLTLLGGGARDDLSEVLARVGPFFCGCVALLGVLTRSARLRVDTDGVAWGWGGLVVRMRRAAVRVVRVYTTSTVALVPRLGFTWHLSGRDWERFADFPEALRECGFPVDDARRAAPLLSRLQGYGLALDLLLLANVVLALLVFLIT